MFGNKKLNGWGAGRQGVQAGEASRMVEVTRKWGEGG